jgi:hypothetical protein
MVRFMDELHGSVGERVTVADLRNGIVREGSIEELNEPQERVRVRYDDGTLVSVGIGFVTLLTDEDDGDG